VYIPDPEPVTLHHLARSAAYSAAWFDPVSGKQADLPPIRSADDGTATCDPPPNHDHDWVLILQVRERPCANPPSPAPRR
jgi:hypothetical protein